MRLAQQPQGKGGALGLFMAQATGRQLFGNDQAIRRLVIHRQHPNSVQVEERHNHAAFIGGLSVQVDRKPERRTLTFDAAHSNLAAHFFSQPLGDDQPQPGPAKLAGG